MCSNLWTHILPVLIDAHLSLLRVGPRKFLLWVIKWIWDLDLFLSSQKPLTSNFLVFFLGRLVFNLRFEKFPNQIFLIWQKIPSAAPGIKCETILLRFQVKTHPCNRALGWSQWRWLLLNYITKNIFLSLIEYELIGLLDVSSYQVRDTFACLFHSKNHLQPFLAKEINHGSEYHLTNFNWKIWLRVFSAMTGNQPKVLYWRLKLQTFCQVTPFF